MTNWQERLIQKDSTLHIHLIGMGGAGLSAIATVLLQIGFKVSGSDAQRNARLVQLEAAGATVYGQQVAANLVTQPDVILMSSAIGPENPERQAAERLALPLVKRSQFLPALLANRQVIAVAGTHGKSTTTSMIVKILREAGIDAGYIIGTELAGYGNAAAGSSDYFVIEADEYDYMFLGLRPTVAVLTNIEWDHPDCFPTAAHFHDAFEQFVDLVHPTGTIVGCVEDAGVRQLMAKRQISGTTWVPYGVDEVGIDQIGTDQIGVEPIAPPLTLSVPGIHNQRNAMAALAVSRLCLVPVETAKESLRTFRGTARRFEQKGEARGVMVIDDYAHHPTEVRVTLDAARMAYPQRRIWSVFQPHTYSRTRQMYREMADSFDASDQVIILDIYAAREVDDGSIHPGMLVAHSSHPAIQHIAKIDGCVDYLAEQVTAGDVVITLGAGDGNRVGDLLLERLA